MDLQHFYGLFLVKLVIRPFQKSILLYSKCSNKRSYFECERCVSANHLQANEIISRSLFPDIVTGQINRTLSLLEEKFVLSLDAVDGRITASFGSSHWLG